MWEAFECGDLHVDVEAAEPAPGNLAP